MASFVAFLTGKFRSAALVVLLLHGCFTQAQTGWDQQAKEFVKTAAKNRYKYTIQEVQASIDASSALIKSFYKDCSPQVKSSLYLARANLRIFKLEYKVDSADGAYTAPPAELSRIKSDFLMAQSLCQSCKCGMYDNMMEFYGSYGTAQQADSLEKEARAMGKPTDHNYLGIDLGFTPQKKLASVGIGFLNAWTVRQPKKWVDASGKKYRQCKYDYPMAVGYFFVGYEASFDDSKYRAAKLDPVWFNYIVSVHPLQLLYADARHGHAFVYRPEIGLSFSTLAVNYALNIPFSGSLNFLAQHNLSVRFTIPAIRFN